MKTNVLIQVTYPLLIRVKVSQRSKRVVLYNSYKFKNWFVFIENGSFELKKINHKNLKRPMNAVVSMKMNARLVVLVCARPESNVSISMVVTDVTVTKDTHDKVRNRPKHRFCSKMTNFEN